MFARHKSTLGSNFLLCVSRFGFSKSAFLNGSININYVIRHHCLSVTDNNHFYVAQFMRESIVMRDAVGRHGVEFYLYPTVGTVLIHSVKPELTQYRTYRIRLTFKLSCVWH